MEVKLDHIDRQILRVLVDDGRASVETVAEAVGLSPTPTRRRIRNLEASGVIEGYRAVVDPELCGLELGLYVLVTLTVGDSKLMEEFEDQVQNLPEIHRCDLIAGENCYILSIRLKNMKYYNQYLRKTLVNMPGVYAIETRTIIGGVKDSPHFALP